MKYLLLVCSIIFPLQPNVVQAQDLVHIQAGTKIAIQVQPVQGWDPICASLAGDFWLDACHLIPEGTKVRAYRQQYAAKADTTTLIPFWVDAIETPSGALIFLETSTHWYDPSLPCAQQRWMARVQFRKDLELVGVDGYVKN